MSIIVREATSEDLPALARLRWLWSEENQPPIEGAFDEYAEQFVDWYRARDDFVAFVAVADAVVGMGFLALAPRVPDPRTFERRTGDIQSMYVIPAHRGRGVGARLVEALVQHGRAAGCTRITVHSDADAISLYTRAGFEVRSNLLMLALA